MGLPGLVCIISYRFRREEGPPSAVDVIKQISQRYGSACSMVEDGIRVRLGSSDVYIIGIDEDDCQIFLAAVGSLKSDAYQTLSMEEQKTYDGQIGQFTELLPDNPLSMFTVRIGWAGELGEAQDLLQRYLNQAERSIRSVGVVHGCLLATILEKEDTVGISKPLRRELILLPLGRGLPEATRTVWGLYGEMASLASYAGRLNDFRVGHDLILKQIDASEQSTQVRINEISLEMRKPIGQVKPESLEGVLREVITLFSNLSILSSAMRRDYVKARVLLRRAKRMFGAWNEEALAQYPTNSLIEMGIYEEMISPFKDFINRVDALRIQLNTILDAVRTYLGIQQQRLSIEEQASSKDQLIRLVNLQEILHKLEILIVAVYITEMARIVFEVLAHEMANLLTALFIPLALLTAIGISRILHRKH